ncbi:MAG: BMP family ABC transporter substrate-binding protein [Clostridium sp.]|nr:BMP family ABC transporter substrate-binding protein [Clostridium sp.]
MEEDARKAYSKLRKIGKKEVSSMGKLLCLEEILKDETIVASINLGTFEIPIKKIIGTYSHFRSICFSKNFNPIMDDQSEFMGKWVEVYNHHIKEGISDPIKVYEYYNYYYVIEGNKRVSVIKSFGAVSMLAEVIRIVPAKDENNEKNSIYYEFLDFYNKTSISSIWFTKKHSFEKLMNMLLNYKPELKLGDNKYKHFISYVYNVFRDEYIKCGGDKLKITTGDAFIEYIKIYGIHDIVCDDKFKNIMKQFLKEAEYFNVKNIRIKSDENISEKSATMSIVNLVAQRPKLKVAFVYAKSINTSTWSYEHEAGRLYVDKKFANKITTMYIQNVPENGEAYEYIKSLVYNGCNVIFTTSPVFRNATLKCALEFPKVKFFNCSNEKSYHHMSSYFGRLYEPRFITGIIAGTLTKTNTIGYLETSLKKLSISEMDSFALGAKIVNPYAKIKVFLKDKNISNYDFKHIRNECIKDKCDIVCIKNLKGYIYPICSVEKNKIIASSTWNWGIYYEKILSSILNDSFNTLISVFGTNYNLINFFFGMREQVVDVSCSKEYIPAPVQKLVKAMKKMIIKNEFNPFTGPIYDNKGSLRIAEEELLTPEEIININWFCDNIIFS